MKIQGKSRGSTNGLLNQKNLLRVETRNAILTAIIILENEQEDVIWTNIGVCKKAGLLSTVSLKKMWNRDLLQRVVDHNILLNQKKSESINANDEQVSNIFIERKFKKRLIKMKEQLLIYAAENTELVLKNKRLEEKLNRLEKLRRLVVV